MIRNFIIILITLITFVINLFSQPKLQIEKGDTVNWGVVKMNNTPVKETIKLFNVGKDTLKILSVKPGCGCTTAPLDKKDIEPGGFAKMDISLNLPSKAGKIHKTIAVNTNESEKASKTIHLLVDVFSPLKFFPAQFITLPGMTIGQETTGKIVITNATDTDISIKELNITPSNLIVNLKNNDIIKANEAIDVIAKFTPNEPGPLMGVIKFKTTHEDMPSVAIQVRGNVAGDDSQAPKSQAPAKPKVELKSNKK